jgi:multiple sugar transport system permease protein
VEPGGRYVVSDLAVYPDKSRTLEREPVRRPFRVPWRGIVIYSVSLIVALWIILPFSWIVISSFMHEVDAIAVPPEFIPHRVTLDNYLAFFEPQLLRANEFVGQGAAQDAPRALLNSTIVAVSIVIVNIVLGSMAGYAFARLRFRGSTSLLVFYIGSRMVPPLAVMIALYGLVQSLGLLDSLGALILTYTTFTVPYSIWILQSYFRTIPIELEDAARVDGCNWLGMMWRVFLPVATPSLIAVALFSFLSSWGEFLYALIFTASMNSKTMPIIVSQFVTDINTSPVLLSASGVLAVIPPLVLALMFQKLIITGIAAGAVKG